MRVPGAMTATSAAMVRKKPPEAALLPFTKTTTGAFDEVMSRTISSTEETSPPGVSSLRMKSPAPPSFALASESLR